MDLAEEVYRVMADFPKDERFGLISQLNRCAVSVPSNISEGAGRASNKQFRQFLEFSMGSCNEIQTQIELSKRFNYLSLETGNKIIDEAIQVYRMIFAFYNSMGND